MSVGHPEPFKVNYIGVGNEDCGQDYLARFQYISTKIKAKYPNVKTIISSGFTYKVQDVQINLTGAPSLSETASVTYLSGDLNDGNSFFDKTLVSPKEEKISGVSSNFVYKARANSLSVLEIQKK